MNEVEKVEVNEGKKVWSLPEVKELPVKQTEGGGGGGTDFASEIS